MAYIETVNQGNSGSQSWPVAATIADGADVTLGAKADAKSAATDTTPVSVMSVLKEISAMEQAPASRAVTNAGTFAVQEATLDGCISSSKLAVRTASVGDVVVEISDGTNVLGTTAHPVQTNDQGNVAQASTTSGETGPLVQMATVTSAPSDTNAKTNPLRGDAAGCLRINPAGQTGSYTSKTSSGSGNQTLTVSAGKKWKLYALNVIVTTDSTVATRTVRVKVTDGTNSFALGVSAVTQAAGVSNVQYFFSSTPSPSAAGVATTNGIVIVFLPVPLVLGPTFTVATTIVNVDASDTVSIYADVEEYND